MFYKINKNFAGQETRIKKLKKKSQNKTKTNKLGGNICNIYHKGQIDLLHKELLKIK